MRALLTSPALVVVTMLMVWPSARRFLLSRAVLAYLIIGACANLSISALAGYINPWDYVQDGVAAQQFLQHRTMYPDNLPQLGSDELSAPIAGLQVLGRMPFVQSELKTATFEPAAANAHPPVLGILLAAPVFFLGLRGSFLFVLALSVVLLYWTVSAILRELFPGLAGMEFWAVMAFVFGWYPVAACLREGQPAVILFALITAGWLMLRRNRPWMAGCAIGLAACLQVFPALLVLLLAMRYRRAFVSAIGTVVLLNLAAATVAVQGTFQQWLSTEDMVSRDSVPRFGNLSIAGLIAGFCRGMGSGVNVKIVILVVVLAIAGALVVFLTRWNHGLDVEYSVFVAAMLLASPITWERYLSIVLLPLGQASTRVSTRHARVRALLVLFLMSFSISASVKAFHWLSGNLGFVAGWLAISAPSFAIMAILLMLPSRSVPRTE